jgi:hypothetical protein
LGDSGTVDVQVPDKTTSKVDVQTSGGAFVSYFGDSDTSFGSSGTGIFTPFLRIQGSPTEQGYNTDGTLQFDSKVGTWTHAIKVSQIPQRPCPTAATTPPIAVGSKTCFELFNDVNESNTAKYVSLNKVEVYFTSSANTTGYPFTTANPPNTTTTAQYTFNGNILIHDVNQGSGRGDLRYDIPINGTSPITIPANCHYGNPSCNTYFLLYSQWGTTPGVAPDGNTYGSEGGFEEWKVKVYPIGALQILKESTKSGNPLVSQAGAVFHVANTTTGYSANVTDNGAGDDDSTIGKVCISGLDPGTYTVTETTPPTGYGSGTAVNGTGTVVTGTDCGGVNPPTTANSAVFTDPPLGQIGVRFTDLGSGETHASIVCTKGTTTVGAVSENGLVDPAFDDTNETFTNLAPGTYSCQVVIDP